MTTAGFIKEKNEIYDLALRLLRCHFGYVERRIVTWNVNGIRSVGRKGLLEWLSFESPDIFCIQEIKAHPDDLEKALLTPFDYKSIWFPASRRGYSGVAVYTKQEPLSVQKGLGLDAFDSEGRTLIIEFQDFVLVNCYFPNSQRDHARLGYKLDFCNSIFQTLETLRKQKKKIIICGDFNIAHKEIDLRNPKTNTMNAGFLPEERAWLDKFVGAGYIDAFRNFCNDPHHYTWWSYRPGVREKNIGWRLDYHFVNPEMKGHLLESKIFPDVQGSDHCPVSLKVSL